MSWDFVLILVVLGLLVPWRGAGRVRRLLRTDHLSTPDRLSLYASTIAFQWFAAAIVIWRWFAHGGNGASLGLTVPDRPLALLLGAGLAVTLSAMQLASLRRLARLPRDQQGVLGELVRKFMPQNAVESLAFVGLVVTVALCEEIVYRGFVFGVLSNAAVDVPVVGIVGSALFFGVAHVYQGRRGILLTFIVGLLFALVRVWSDSLAPSLVAHLLTDLLAGLIAPRMVAAADRAAMAAGEAK